MPRLRTTTSIDAPPATVAGALRHAATAERAFEAPWLRVSASTSVAETLVVGDEFALRVVAVGVGALPGALRLRVVRAEADALRTVLVAGPLPELEHESLPVAAHGRTSLVESVRWRAPLGLDRLDRLDRLGKLGKRHRTADAGLLRRLLAGMLARRARAVRELAEEWASRPVVVGAAIVSDGRLLAQQRRYPARDAGRWELPGGRVEPGEDESAAIVRECREELDVSVWSGERVGTDVPLRNGMLLRVHRATLAGGAPRAVEHRALRWLSVPELSDVDWLDADRVLVRSLRELLRAE